MTVDLAVDWNEVIFIENHNPDESFNSFFNNIDSLGNNYIQLKKLTKNEIKHKFKPWITLGLRSMNRSDMIYKEYIKAKNSDINPITVGGGGVFFPPSKLCAVSNIR